MADKLLKTLDFGTGNTYHLAPEWGNVQDKPAAFPPEEHTHSQYITQHQDISGKADKSALTSHTGNTTVHITAAERTAWNNKSNFSGNYNDLTNKPTIPTVPVQSVNGKTGAVSLSASDVKADPAGTAASAVSTHAGNTTVHITAAERTAWNSKAAGSHNHDGVYAPKDHTHTVDWGDIQNKPEDIGGGKADSVEWDDVKNKPFGVTVEQMELFNGESTSEDAFGAGIYAHTLSIPEDFVPTAGSSVTVTIDGTEFNTTWKIEEATQVPYIGNLSKLGWLLGIEAENTGEEYCFMEMGFGMCYAITDETQTTTNVITMVSNYEIVTKIDEKYLPDPVGECTEGTVFVINNKEVTALAGAERFNLAASLENIASGYCSHAEGYGTTASGNYSHAEGNQTIASEASTHAEGFGTKAIWANSHAEGQETVANATRSHAEGYGTTASGENQHVQGKYNIEDTNSVYAHIVGNGTSTLRSNAHTLDWNGNAWFAGTVEGTGFILKSPNGTRFKITVADNGTLAAAKV